MTETETSSTPAASAAETAVPAKDTKRDKKHAANKKAPAHPKYSEMITTALEELKDRSGSSRQALIKYIVANFKVDESKASNQLRLALKRLVSSGTLKQVKGAGASGSFKLAKADDVKPATSKRGKILAAKKAKAPKKVEVKKSPVKPAPAKKSRGRKSPKSSGRKGKRSAK